MTNKALSILNRALDAGRLHHAVLLYGADIHTLEDVAKSVATRLFGRPCEKHPDLFELRPEGKMRFIKIGAESEKVGGDWAPNTMRRLLKDIRQSSIMGGAKVAIVYEADRMNVQAANAFLKTLEEPPSGTTIFMLTTRPNDLLDTIRSRCISLRVDCAPAPINDEAWTQWIENFKTWQKLIMGGIGRKISPTDALMRCYGLLTEFDTILSRLADDAADIDEVSEEELDEEMKEAIKVGNRRALRKQMLSDIEESVAACALGGDGVPAVKLARSIGILEKAAGLMELNMADTPALEFFMLSSLRIWTR